MWRPPQNPLDKPLEEAVADSIAIGLIDGNVIVLDRRDLARRAALEGFRQAVDLASQTLREMAADHEQAGQFDQATVLREAAKQIRSLPQDLP